MQTIKLLLVSVIDSTNLSAKFSSILDENISVDNVVIESQSDNVPNPDILEVTVNGDTLSIITQPLTSLAAYYISFQSSSTIDFKSINGDAIIFNDGVSNKQLILGPIEAENPIKQALSNYLLNNVYNIDDNSNVGKYLQSLSIILSKALYDVGQSKNENYLSFTVTDEQKERSGGPFDRLNEEGAYEILRIGKQRTDAQSQLTFNFNSFPDDPVSLLKTLGSETLDPDSVSAKGKFNINELTLNISNRFLTKLISVRVIYSDASPDYIYNIEKFGYQILESKYDSEFAFTQFLLLDSQIKLNDQILNDNNFSVLNIFQVIVSYEYKNKGRIIDPLSLVVDTVLPSGREALPPIKNIFNLLHAPIVSTNDTAGSIGDVVLTDPNSVNQNGLHPAFLYEIPFRNDYLPSRPGEYSIEYSTGTVYVFGSDYKNDGTGAFPPIANYNYRNVFKASIDFVYDSDVSDIIALPNGSMLNSAANIEFNFEQVLAEDIDYKAALHNEILEERINNNLVAINVIKTEKSPITNVFRIFNETSGEIYKTIRWNDNKIYFNFDTAPQINLQLNERASFKDSLNELLFVSEIIDTVNVDIKIFKCFLKNNNIISASEDCIGSSINTSAVFSNIDIFSKEIYFDNIESDSTNLLRLNTDGYYEIDYKNGTLYCAVSSTQTLNIGTISYKYGYIVPEHPHIVTVNDIYYKVITLGIKDKHFDYSNFSDGSILPKTFDVANERFLNNDPGFSYLIDNDSVGTIVDAQFTPGVTSNIKFVRGLFEFDDLQHNTNPLNFSNECTINGKTITVGSIINDEYHVVQYDGSNYFINLNKDLFYQSPNISLTIDITRLSDGYSLWNGSGTVVIGSPLKLVLPGLNSPQVGDFTHVIYSFNINNAASVVVDYNRGDYYIDYRYLADEIIISYEYGDNVIDFRESSALSQNDKYFVTYKVGALRDGLLKNFGTLIDIPILNSLDVSFERERYRDALIAALGSFTKGPTISAIQEIVNTIVHTPPEIIESAFQNWSVGKSLLSPEPISTIGSFELLPGKFGNGVLLDKDQTVKFPISSNLRLEEGTLSSWVIPKWDGIDNDANLKIKIFKNGIIVPEEKIFIGPSGYHPDYNLDLLDGYSFIKLNKLNDVLGSPNKSKDGVFIYYDKDITGLFNRWYLDVIDGYGDGYSSTYNIKINTDGKFYDSKSLVIPKPSSTKIFTGVDSLTVNITNTNTISHQGITFIADNQHYLFDFGHEKNHNRFSLFKDEGGYLNFRVIDDFKNVYSVSADISSWKAEEQHHVAVSWALNSNNQQDELHLFVDGFEFPNIIKYGTKINPYLHEKFRTINPEEIVGSIPKNIVGSTDLITTSGSAIVSSSINFSANNILAGDIIFIEENGFNINGYTILTVNGQQLTLNTNMPFTSTGNKYSVNKTSFNVVTEIDIYKNIAIYLLHSVIAGTDLQVVDESNQVTSTSTNFQNLNIVAGYLLRINEVGFENHYTIINVSGNTLTLDDDAPLSFTNASFDVYSSTQEEIPGQRALRLAYTISKDNNNKDVLSIRDKALKDDIVLIKTLGLNHKRTKKRYYLWSNSDNIIKTRLPSPVSLENANVTHIILPSMNVGPLNSTLTLGVFHSNEIFMDQPSVSDNGRTLNISIAGDNINFTPPVNVTIHGTIGGVPGSSEVISFSDVGSKNTINKFNAILDGYVTVKPLNSLKNALTIEIKEKLPITVAESSTDFPTIRYSYQVKSGNTLGCVGGNIITDTNGFFTSQDTKNYIIIYSPPLAAGTYQIQSISSDHLSATISNSLSAFSNGVYEILNVSSYRSGLQNGFFTFEVTDSPGEPYLLNKGWYEFEYFTYLSAPFKSRNLYGYIGTDFNNKNSFNGIVDEFQILSEKLTDTRIGETISANQKSITKEFNAIKATKPSIDTLMLSHFDTFPFTNDSDTYITAEKNFIQSSRSVNENFGKSVVITNNPIVVDNSGILNSKTEGTIEFWMQPLLDMGNDPEYRFYFDAAGIISEKATSLNKSTIAVKGSISKILNIKLQVGDQKTDYFAGGLVSSDSKTIILNRALPNEETPVIVNYIPSGLNGDRISIYKDSSGYVNFNIRATNIDYQVRGPAIWSKNTWHRIKASYKINNGNSIDELRLFLDGYEQGNVRFGNGLLFGQNQVFGSSFLGAGGLISSIKFQDSISEFSIGSDYTQAFGAYSVIDNLRISNISRPLFRPFGESIDVNYSTNLNIVFPVAKDLYTTYLLDFDSLVKKNTDFVVLNNKKTGLFDFTVNIFDSFGIVNGSTKVKDVLETILKTLKPANSRMFVRYL